MLEQLTRRDAALARRVILVVLDGLRADLVGDARFPNLAHLAATGACTAAAMTVLPSVTACAMTSLLSGVAPVEHGVRTDRFTLPRVDAQQSCLGREVVAAGMPVTGIVRQVPWLLRPLAARLVAALGLTSVRFASPQAHSLLHAALPFVEQQDTGLLVMHWPDADAIGHRAGWMSPAYVAASARMDHALGALRIAMEHGEPETLLVVVADHGGGGRVPTHHDSAHALDCTIPIILHGPAVRPTRLRDGLSLLDVPPTILAALGLEVPASYAGTPILEAFRAHAGRADALLASTAA